MKTESETENGNQGIRPHLGNLILLLAINGWADAEPNKSSSLDAEK
ncbi:hypothetical protein VCBJG01_1449 [Vibrio cholerae BJG-01]|jgi:hypothetical protein|nr:hypothetical protein VCBJG01_1449 [Vibrio cholerae BJG-01]